jgi:hypothetical protein
MSQHRDIIKTSSVFDDIHSYRLAQLTYADLDRLDEDQISACIPTLEELQNHTQYVLRNLYSLRVTRVQQSCKSRLRKLAGR